MQEKKISDKLVRVERTINIYKNENDNLFDEINIDFIPFDELKKIVPPKEDDPLLYDGYELDAKQLEDINAYLTEKIKPNFDLYSYILVCGGIYDWEAK
jgi:hypothetical protein